MLPDFVSRVSSHPRGFSKRRVEASDRNRNEISCDDPLAPRFNSHNTLHVLAQQGPTMARGRHGARGSADFRQLQSRAPAFPAYPGSGRQSLGGAGQKSPVIRIRDGDQGLRTLAAAKALQARYAMLCHDGVGEGAGNGGGGD